MNKPYQNKPNTGAVFQNDKQGKENAPDYKGNLDVNGESFYVSAWMNTDRNGRPYLKLSVAPQEATHSEGIARAREAVKPVPAPATIFDEGLNDDDIPF